MSIKKAITLGISILLSVNFFAQQTIDAKNTANFEMRAHTTAGYDFEKKQSGLETSIDQIQVWFEIFPYNTYGVNPESKKNLNVSIRAEGLKYGFKWFDMYRQPTNEIGQEASNTGRYTEAKMDNFEAERLVAEVSYKNFFFTIADTNNPIWFSSASLQGIFDDVQQKTGDQNKVGFPLTGMTRNFISTTQSSVDISGLLSLGYRSETLSSSIKVGSKDTWENNTENAWVLGGSVEVKPIEAFSANANVLSTVNYNKLAGYTDLTQFGTSADYTIAFSDTYALKPYIGFDGLYKNNAMSWELGTGVTFYWRGTDYKIPYDIFNIWNLKIPVGLSAAMNINQDSELNIMVSMLEDTASGGLLPNIGGFIQFEIRNALATKNKDARIGVAGQIDYKLTKKILPYIFGKYLQGYSSGKLTKTDELNTRIGILFTPAPRFSIDVCYERLDTIGEKANYDNGTLTSRFAIKL